MFMASRLRAITVSHFIVNLRQVYLSESDNHAVGTLRMSTVRFATSIAGNLGAPLHTTDASSSFDTPASLTRRGTYTSNNPLAVGLPRPEEHTALLSEKCALFSHCFSPQPSCCAQLNRLGFPNHEHKAGARGTATQLKTLCGRSGRAVYR